jgi:hypothetical protein
MLPKVQLPLLLVLCCRLTCSKAATCAHRGSAHLLLHLLLAAVLTALTAGNMSAAAQQNCYIR